MANSKLIYGIDRSVFPGHDTMTWLRKNADIRFACFYLGPTANHGDASWMGQQSALAVDGWGLIPTYVGQQAHVKLSDKTTIQNPALNATRGKTDGNEACDLLIAAGFARGTLVYLDLEEGDEPTGPYQAYILAWLASVKARLFVPAIYCPGGALRWALRYARVVWLAAPENLDSTGKAISVTLDPKNLPGPSAGRGPVAGQFLWEIEFSALTQPADGNHGPRFDLNTGIVADPSDFAAVDWALTELTKAPEGSLVNWPEQSARIAIEEFKNFRQSGAAAIATAPSASSPTSDPHCGDLSKATDRLMPRDKVALDLVETTLATDWMSATVDTGLSEEDFADMSSATVSSAAPKPDRWAAVKWPARDADSPDYGHMATSAALPLPASGIAELGEFEITPEDIELVLGANRMDPIGYDDLVAIAVRGGRLGKLKDKAPMLEIEDVASAWVTETRPDHRKFQCLIGFYRRASIAADRKFSLFTASTVPNAEYVEDWYLCANARKASGEGNMLPTGCYVYRIGVHNSPHAGAIKPALRLTDSMDLHVDGTATVIRTKNDQSYGMDDVWCKTVPADNVHCSFQVDVVDGWGAPYSSAGCLTIRGKQTPTDQWAKAQAIMTRQGQDKRCDLALITGRDLAIAVQLRTTGQTADAATVQNELGRLRPGSQGTEVGRLQTKLGLEVTDYFGSVLKKALVDEQSRRKVPIDGIYSPALDTAWGWTVFGT